MLLSKQDSWKGAASNGLCSRCWFFVSSAWIFSKASAITDFANALQARADALR